MFCDVFLMFFDVFLWDSVTASVSLKVKVADSQLLRQIVASEVPVEHGASGENLNYDVVEALLRCCWFDPHAAHCEWRFRVHDSCSEILHLLKLEHLNTWRFDRMLQDLQVQHAALWASTNHYHWKIPWSSCISVRSLKEVRSGSCRSRLWMREA